MTVRTQYSPLLEQTVELLVKCFAATNHHKLLRSASDVSYVCMYVVSMKVKV